MKVTVIISIIMAALLPALAYGQAGLWPGVLLSAAVGLLWLVGQGYGREWAGTVGLVGMVGLAALGAWLNMSPGWLLAGGVAALVAWDLAAFSRRLALAGPPEVRAILRRRHLWRLFAVAGIGLIAGGLALSLRLNLGLGWALGAGLLLVLALGQVVRAILAE